MDVNNETLVANKFFLKNCISDPWAICLVEVVSMLVHSH